MAGIHKRRRVYASLNLALAILSLALMANLTRMVMDGQQEQRMTDDTQNQAIQALMDRVEALEGSDVPGMGNALDTVKANMAELEKRMKDQ